MHCPLQHAPKEYDNMTVRARPAAREVCVRESVLLLDVYITDFRLFLAFDDVLVIT
jgi:hypothetical protein